jgi:hypothetical protein
VFFCFWEWVLGISEVIENRERAKGKGEEGRKGGKESASLE